MIKISTAVYGIALLVAFAACASAQNTQEVKAKDSPLAIKVPKGWVTNYKAGEMLFLTQDRKDPGGRIFITAYEETAEDFGGDDLDKFVEAKLDIYKEEETVKFRDQKPIKKGKIGGQDGRFVQFKGTFANGAGKLAATRCVIAAFEKDKTFYLIFGMIGDSAPTSLDKEIIKAIKTVEFKEGPKK